VYGVDERHIQGFGEKPEGKRPLGRPRHRWEDTIKMDLQELGCGGVDWTGLSWLRMGRVGRHLPVHYLNFRFHKMSGELLD
jgi:hypothetical protein